MTAQQEQRPRSPSGQDRATRLGAGERLGFFCQGRKQSPDSRFVQMVKKKIGEGGGKGRCLFHPIQNIVGDHGGKPMTTAQVCEGGFWNDRLPVDEKDPGSVSAVRIGAQENRAE